MIRHLPTIVQRLLQRCMHWHHGLPHGTVARRFEALECRRLLTTTDLTPLLDLPDDPSQLVDVTASGTFNEDNTADEYTLDLVAGQTLTAFADPSRLLMVDLAVSGPSGFLASSRSPFHDAAALLQTLAVSEDGLYTIRVERNAFSGADPLTYELRVLLNGFLETHERSSARLEVLTGPGEPPRYDMPLNDEHFQTTRIDNTSTVDELNIPDPPADPAHAASLPDQSYELYFEDVRPIDFHLDTRDVVLRIDELPGNRHRVTYQEDSAAFIFNLYDAANNLVWQHMNATDAIEPGESVVVGPLDTAGNDNAGEAEPLDDSFRQLSETVSQTTVAGTVGQEKQLLGGVTTDDEDWFHFSLNDGEGASLSLNADSETTELALFDTSGTTLLAEGVAPSPTERRISSFLDASDDSSSSSYLVRVTGVGNYSLTLNRNAVHESDSNSSMADAQHLAELKSVIGHISGTEEDWFSFSADTGDSLSVSLLAISAGTSMEMNDLEPSYQVFDADSNVVNDGPLAGGTYFVKVSTSNAVGGAYLLELKGVTGEPDTRGPVPINVVVNAGDSQRSLVRSIAIQFDEDVSSSIEASDFRITDVDSLHDVDPSDTAVAYGAETNTAVVIFPGLVGGTLDNGNFTITLRAAQITDGAGNTLDANADGVGGDDFAFDLYRLFGDTDADRDVDFINLFEFRSAFQTSISDPLFNPLFDSDLDQDVDFVDLFKFRSHFLDALAPPVEIELSLFSNSGSPDDTVTNDVSVSGRVQFSQNVIAVRAGFDAAAPAEFVDVSSLIGANGAFRLDRDDLEFVLGEALTNGLYTLHLQALGAGDKTLAIRSLDFELDDVPPHIQALSSPAINHTATHIELEFSEDMGQPAFDASNYAFVALNGAGSGDVVQVDSVEELSANHVRLHFNPLMAGVDYELSIESVTSDVAGNSIEIFSPFILSVQHSEPIAVTTFNATTAALPVGLAPERIMSADLNDDDHLDLITTNRGSNDVSILLGDGAGGFVTSATLPVGVAPIGLALGDFNMDGELDIVTANYRSSDLSIRLGASDGTFGDEQRIEGDGNPYSVSIADWNGDDAPDLIVSHSPGSGASVILGNGDGTFSPNHLGRDVESRSYAIATGNIDNDGDLEMLTASFDRDEVAVRVIRPFLDVSVGNGPMDLKLIDIDNDNNLDIVTANLHSQDLSIALGNGDGTFAAEHRVPLDKNPIAFSVVELNGDNHVDLVVVFSADNEIAVLLGHGDATFAEPRRFGVSDRPRSVTAGDFDEDGNLDLAIVSSMSNDVSIVFGDGAGGFDTEQRLLRDRGVGEVVVADIDGDGSQDIVSSSVVSDEILIQFGDAGGGLSAHETFAVGDGPVAFSVSDVNGDNLVDIITTNSFGHDVSILINSGNRAFAEEQRFAAGDRPADLVVGDFNGDGHLDLVVANATSDDVSILLGVGDGTFSAESRNAAGGGPQAVTAAHLNTDDNLDLVIANAKTNDVSVLFGNGDGTFAAQTRHEVGVGPRTVDVNDLNQDGIQDIAVGNAESYNVAILYGKSDGTFTVQQRLGVGSAPSSIVIADLNDDGKNDIITTNFGSNDVSVLFGVASGAFLAEVRFRVGNGPTGFTVVDWDQDDDLDILSANFMSDDISILFNQLN